MTHIVGENLGENLLPGQKVATVAPHQLQQLLELSQHEVVTDEMGHPVVGQDLFSNTVGVI